MRIRPSGLALTISCNASVQLQESVAPLPATEEEQEGTAAHWVARRYIAGYGHELPVGAKFSSENRVWEVTHDMFAGAQLYARALGAPSPVYSIETSMPITRIHHAECGGTPDASAYFADARLAYATCPDGIPPDRFAAGLIKLVRVGDYKYGHRYHEVFEHAQLCGYAAGEIEKQGLNEIDDDLYVELILVQPRSYHRDGPVRVWRTKAINLRNVLNDAQDAADRALMPLNEPLAPLAVTGKHCLDCRARHVCGALQTNSARVVDYAHTAERVELPPMAIGQELAILEDAMKLLKARHTGLAAQAETLIRAGRSVPFYHLAQQAGRLTFFDNVTADEIISFGDLINVNVRRTLKRDDLVVTPTQAVQLGVDPGVMSEYAQRLPGTKKLERDNSVAIRKVFSK